MPLPSERRFPVAIVRRRGFALPMTALLLVGLAAATIPSAAPAEQAESVGAPADVVAIRAAAAAYAEALARGDAEAVKAAWTADGDIVDGWGNRLRPQDEGALGESAPARPRPEFRRAESRLRFITADVAIEDGAVDVVLPGMKTPIEGWFSAIWVRSGNAWKLAGLRESERPLEDDAGSLEDLDWLVGDWEPVADGPQRQEAEGERAIPAGMRMRVRWDAGRTFLVRELHIPAAAADDDAAGAIEVHQRIGWDPVVRRIRSWSFSTDGSRGESTWIRDGDSWVAMQTVFLSDGRQDSVVNIFSFDGTDRCLWRIMPEKFDMDAPPPERVIWVRKAKEGAR